MTSKNYPPKATPQELKRLQTHKPLPEKAEELLLATPWDGLVTVFAAAGISRPRRWLEVYKKALRRGLPEEAVRIKKTESAAQLRVSELKQENQYLLRQLRDAEDALRALRSMELVGPADLAIPQKTTRKGIVKRAVAHLVFSDWHCGEVIEPKRVNGLNEFNPELCRQRVARVTESAIKMTRLHEQAIPIGEVVIDFLGDLVNGELRQSAAATNAMAPIDEAIFCKGLVTAMLDKLLDAFAGKSVTIKCVCGNHGRLTPKLEYKRLVGTSIESIVYHSVAERYASAPDVKVCVSDSDSVTQDILGLRVRSRHGTGINYQGGVGGYLIPAYRMIGKWNRVEPCDYEVFGHLHTFGAPPGVLSNGSLCGYNEFALAHGFERQPPYQAFALYDSRYGRTITAPLVA